MKKIVWVRPWARVVGTRSIQENCRHEIRDQQAPKPLSIDFRHILGYILIKNLVDESLSGCVLGSRYTSYIFVHDSRDRLENPWGTIFEELQNPEVKIFDAFWHKFLKNSWGWGKPWVEGTRYFLDIFVVIVVIGDVKKPWVTHLNASSAPEPIRNTYLLSFHTEFRIEFFKGFLEEFFK